MWANNITGERGGSAFCRGIGGSSKGRWHKGESLNPWVWEEESKENLE